MLSDMTKGPWHVVRYGDGDSLVICEDEAGSQRIAFMATPSSTTSQKHIQANAQAISALPELIEALQEAREALHFHYTEWDGEPEDAVPLQLARAKCDAALLKAGGSNAE